MVLCSEHGRVIIRGLTDGLERERGLFWHSRTWTSLAMAENIALRTSCHAAAACA